MQVFGKLATKSIKTAGGSFVSRVAEEEERVYYLMCFCKMLQELAAANRRHFFFVNVKCNSPFFVCFLLNERLLFPRVQIWKNKRLTLVAVKKIKCTK